MGIFPKWLTSWRTDEALTTASLPSTALVAPSDGVLRAVFDDDEDEDARGERKPVLAKAAYTELMYRPELSGWTPRRTKDALAMADGGDMLLLSDLIETMLEDDRISGVLQTLTFGLLGLPLELKGGNEDARAVLQGTGDEPGEWQAMHQTAELAKLLTWGIMGGIGLAQRIAIPRVAGEPQRYKIEVWSTRWLQYQWQATQGSHWFIITREGRQPIFPGDGSWIMFMPYGRRRPWASGRWRSLAFPWLLKRYSLEDRANFSQVLGSPIWLGKAGAGSSEKQRRKYLSQLIALGKNGKIVLPADWDLKMVEATGRSWEIFDNQISWADKAITIDLAGQLVTTEGNSGFSTGNIHDDIREDIVSFYATALEECLRSQSLEPWAELNYNSKRDAPWPRWDTDKPEDEGEQAKTLQSVGDAIKSLDAALSPHGMRVDVKAICEQYSIPVEKVATNVVSTPIALAPTDVAKTVTVNEVRSSNALGQLLLPDGTPDPRGGKLMADLAAAADVPVVDPNATPQPSLGAP